MKKFFLDNVVLMLIFIVMILIVFFAWGSKEEKRLISLPKIEISLNETTLDEIISNSKDIKYDDNLVIVFDGGKYDEYSRVELKGRGNSTWGQSKSPFQIKFKEKVDLFGMGKAKKWILLANYFDATSLRNDIAFYLEKVLGEAYALEGRFVELYVDGKCLGIYYLTEKIEIGKERVNLKDDYGVIVEVENMRSEDVNCYLTVDSTCLTMRDVVVDSNAKVAMERFRDEFEQLENAAREGDYERVQQLVDVDSLAVYYLLSEFTVNPDAYASSFYFYKDGDGDLIHAGPGWDFDFAMGNKEWVWGYSEDFYLPETVDALKTQSLGGEIRDNKTGKSSKAKKKSAVSDLLFNLIEIPEFQRKVIQIYRERMMGKKEDVLAYIRKQAAIIATATANDNNIWRKDEADKVKSVLYDNLSPSLVFWREVTYLTDWVDRRFEYMDKMYSGRIQTESREI
ncbi:CotH kinase family protein [Candidatus Saccharibacteria bacterium]|nr:CotH kinase family protein [Candidatus Saccharibacteria bacterium]